MAKRPSKKDIVKELIRCGKDPVYFLTKYAKIEAPNEKGGLVEFKLYHYQIDIIKALLGHRNNIILKARQLGMTTVLGGFLAWLMIFHKHQNVILLATKKEKSKIPLRVIKNIIKHLPLWMRSAFVKIDVNNRTSIELENGSRAAAIATSADAGIGEAVSFLLVDEAAHIETIESIWTQISPVLTTGGRSCIMSTPKGSGNFFHKRWVRARDNIGKFNCRFGTYVNPEDPTEIYNDRFMWWVKPGCSVKWFEDETCDDSPREIAQERLCSFLASGDTFVWHEDIERMERHVRNPKSTLNTCRDMWIWKEPEQSGTYLIASDVSRGDADDFSTFHVVRIDETPLEQVAEYRGKIKPDQLGFLLMTVSQKYNNAVIAPENNSGWAGQTIQKIEDAGYPFLYYSRKRQSKMKGQSAPDPYYAAGRNDFLPGYGVSSANRLPMLSKMEQYLRMGMIIINSPRTIEELKTFIVNSANRPEAQRGSHDDLVMALAGLLWVRDEAFLHIHRTGQIANIMIDAMSTSNSTVRDYSDFNFDSNINDRGRIQQYVGEQNKIVLGNGDVESLDWLYSDGDLPITGG